MYGKKISLKKNVLICMLALIPNFKPLTFEYIPVLDQLFNALFLAVSMWSLCNFIYSKKFRLYEWSYFVGLFIFFGYCWTNTLIQTGTCETIIVDTFKVLLVLLNLNYWIKRDKSAFMNAISVLFSCYILVHVITVFLDWNFVDVTDGFYFYGGDIYAIYYTFPMFGIVSLISVLKNNKLDKNSIVLFVLLFSSNIYLLTGAATLALAVTMIMYLLAKHFQEIFSFLNRHLNLRVLFIIICVMSLGIALFNIEKVFSFVIVNLLHKDLTLTSRTIMWKSALPYIAKEPLFGRGFLSGDTVKKLVWGASATHLHNLAFELLFSTGIMGMLLYYMHLRPVDVALNEYRNSKCSVWIKCVFIGYFILMLADFYIGLADGYCLMMLTYLLAKNEEKSTLTTKHVLN